MQIKFLFVMAIDPSKKIEIIYPPLGIGYLVSSLRKHFGERAIEFKVIDRNVEQEIRSFKPDIIGISSVSQNYNKAITYAKIAKKYKLPVMCGGVHISMMPSSLTGDMDVGVMGEGEATICDVLELFRSKGEFTKTALQKIKGIIYWDNGRIATTDKRELICSLDDIPLPARDLFNIQPNTYMFTSRGCPYRCTFCASSRFWNKVRFFSAEYVVNEIEYLVNKYNVKHINFYDDLFPADTKRVSQILNLLKEKNLLKKVDFECSIRANMVDDGIIHLLKEMGVKSIGIGLESGCNETLKYLKGGNIDITDNENAIRVVKKHGISVHGSFVIGSPKESKEDILETLKFIKASKLDGFDIYVLTPFPGTPVWDYAESRGLVDKKMDWDRLNVNFDENYNSAVILSEKLTRKEIYGLFLRFKKNLMTTEINKLYISSDRHYKLNELVDAGGIDIDNRNSAHSLLISQVGGNSFILDVGCSYGYLGEWLIKNKRCAVYGIEVDKTALHKVRTEGLYKDVFEIDLDYPEKYLNELERFNNLNIEFDFIICGDVLEHLKDPTTILAMLSDRLKDGGKILISVPNVANIGVILKLIEGEFNYSETGILDSTHLRFFTKASFMDWIHSINCYILKDYMLDVTLVGSTKHESELSYVKNNYPNTYSILTDAIGEEVKTVQYIYALTKRKQQSEDITNKESPRREIKNIRLIENQLNGLTRAVADLKNKLTNKDEILQKVLSHFYRIIPMNIKTRPSTISDKISIIIPVKNGGEQLRRLLQKIKSQRKVKAIEIIVIDSESTDNSVDIAKEFGASVIKISQKEFNHGATRNLGAKEAKGDYLVFTVQDAMPINDYWLYNMICPFLEYPELAAISSRQFVKPEADLFSLWMSESLIKSFGLEGDTIYSLSDAPREISLEFFDSGTKRRLTFFDNVSSCIKRRVFEEIQFGPLINAEDMDYGVKLIKEKNTLGYLSSTGVYHWHERGADYVFKRHYIGTKANVYVLKNGLQYFFDINNISWEYLAANLLGVYNLISISISEIGEVSPEPIKAVQSFINALQKNMDTLPDKIEKTSKLDSRWNLPPKVVIGGGNDGLEVFSGGDSGLGLLLREIVDGDAVFILKQKYNFKQNFLIPDFMKRLENFAGYLCSKHHTLEGREKDFISCLYKIFAMAAGDALGAYYLEAETLNRLTPELKRIDRLLGKGVCYF